MVGYGSSLRRSRRPGWEDAYLDYDTLRAILEEIECLYEEDIPLPPNADIDNFKANFLTRLRKEIEKVYVHVDYLVTLVTSRTRKRVSTRLGTKIAFLLNRRSLFTLARQGEIAEAVGSLRFADTVLEIHPTRTLTHGDNGYDHYYENTLAPTDSNEYEAESAALLPRGSLVHSLKTPKPLPKTADSLSRPMFRDDQVVTKADTTTDGYTFRGVELLHLLKFICVNAMGFRKILKKHDKICQRAAQYFGREHEHGRHDEHTGTHRLVDGPEDNLQHLANSDSVAVIHSSLLVALSELEAAQMGGMQVYQQIEEGDPRKNFLRNGFPVELVRFKCCVSSIQTLREYAQKVNAPFKNFLSRKAMIIIGQDLGDLERATQQALQILLHFQPDSLLTMDEAALQDWQRRVLLRTGMELDLLESGSFTDLEDSAHSWGGVNSASMIINLLSTLLYTVRNRERWSRLWRLWSDELFLNSCIILHVRRSTIILSPQRQTATLSSSGRTVLLAQPSLVPRPLQPYLPPFSIRFGTPRVPFDRLYSSPLFCPFSETCCTGWHLPVSLCKWPFGGESWLGLDPPKS